MISFLTAYILWITEAHWGWWVLYALVLALYVVFAFLAGIAKGLDD